VSSGKDLLKQRRPKIFNLLLSIPSMEKEESALNALTLLTFFGERLISWLLQLVMPYLYVERFVALLNQENPVEWTGVSAYEVLPGD
jgi:hypothetical protein